MLFRSAQRKARSLGFKPDLGLEKHGAYIKWMGIRGMKWQDLAATVQHKLRSSPPPKVLLIHLGSNDLVDTHGSALGKVVTQDLHNLHALLPDTVLIWSEVLPRRTWQGADNPAAVDRKRKRLNRRAILAISQLGGKVVRHGIVPGDPGLYRDDNVHLSDVGTALFINAIQETLSEVFE